MSKELYSDSPTLSQQRDSKKFLIAFLPASDNGLSFRGTEVAMFYYAFFNQRILNNSSIICLGKSAYNHPTAFKLFSEKFPIIYFETTNDLENQLLTLKVDALYCIRSGNIKEPMLKSVPMFVHCVYDMSQPHGLVYAGVSESVAKKFNSTVFVPHIVYLDDGQDDYRDVLNIPKNAVVFGRHGGVDTFDLIIAKEAIIRILNSRSDIYFLFAVRPNLLHDVDHPRFIGLESFSDLGIKRRFINTLDYFIHAQSLGETFGLSCMEASLANKPVITWNGGRCQEHLRILGNKCIKYNNAEELFNIMNTANPQVDKTKDWNATREYTPEKVMEIFDRVFIKSLLTKV